MKSTLSTLALGCLAFASTGQALAQSSMSMPMAPAASQSVQNQSVTEGEVRKVDMAAQKLTLKHGDIKNLGMPGMTMVFKVTDPKMLSAVKEGDKVRFTADRVNGALTVTSIAATSR
ncbi:MAG: copper-binding protein [Pseudomonadota bacterium]|nr:copper-binding protein [Pseudomonadota bacterium]